MCGGLRSYLRVCGHDTAYVLDDASPGDPATEDAAIARRARAEGRTLVTRDVQLAGRAEGAILLESREVGEQLRELRAAGVPLEPVETPAFCGACNGPLARLGDDEATPGYAPDPDEVAVWRCRHCGQCFWKGSHWERIEETLGKL